MGLMDAIGDYLEGEATFDSVLDCCDAVRCTPEDLAELKEAIDCYDLLDLYICLFSVFEETLTEEEKHYYAAKFQETFDEDLYRSIFAESLFPYFEEA